VSASAPHCACGLFGQLIRASYKFLKENVFATIFRIMHIGLLPMM
jgi:hypothetical protein